MKPCSPLHPVNVGLLLLGAGAIGLAARRSGSGNVGALKKAGSRMITGFDFFDVPNEPAPPITRAVRFRDSQKGYVFDAHGRRWRVINSPPAHLERGLPHRIIQAEAYGYLMNEPALYAALEGDTLVVHNVSKHGPFRPVGKVLWREDMSAAA